MAALPVATAVRIAASQGDPVFEVSTSASPAANADPSPEDLIALANQGKLSS